MVWFSIDLQYMKASLICNVTYIGDQWRTRPCSYPVGSRYYDISGRTCQCPKDTNCQKSQKAVWRYEFKEVLLEALLLVRQLFYLIREWKQSESYPTIYQKSRNKIKSGSVRTHLPTPMRCSCSYGRGTLLSFYRHRHQVPVNCIFAYFLLVSYILLSQFSFDPLCSLHK